MDRPVFQLRDIPNELLFKVIHKMPKIDLILMSPTCSFMNSFIKTHQSKLTLLRSNGLGLRSREFPLRVLPQKTLFQVLNKMNHSELCRVRVSRSCLDKFVETAVEKFPSLKTDITLRVNIHCPNKIFGSHSFGNGSFVVEDDFKYKLSAFTINRLTLDTTEASDDDVYGKLTNFVCTLNPKCESASIVGLPAEKAVEIADRLDCVGEIRVDPRPRAVKSQCILAILNKARRKSQIYVHLEDPNGPSDVGLFDAIKGFRGIADFTSTSLLHFHSVIRDLYQNGDNSDLSHLDHMRFVSRFDVPFFGPNDRRTPPCNIIWTRPRAQIEGHHMNYPRYIRRMDLKTSCVFIAESKDFIPELGPIWEERMYVTKKTDWDILETLSRILELPPMDPELKEEYVNANSERQAEIIQQAYMELTVQGTVSFDSRSLQDTPTTSGTL